MKIAAHITFFYSSTRLQYLEKVIERLLEIDPEMDIFIYTNRESTLYPENNNIKFRVFNYRKFTFARFSKNSLFYKLGIKWLVHPFYLAWENRENIENLVEEYEVQMYLEDDIEFKKENFHYWLRYKKQALSNNFNLGFFRYELDKENKKLLTDITWPLTEVIELEGKKYLMNKHNPYCGFWIMEKKELKKFIKSPEWRFEFDGYGIRAKAAVGWHGINMNRYKGTIIPLIKNEDSLVTPIDSAVHHLPNNYIGKGRYCTKKFPLEIQEN